MPWTWEHGQDRWRSTLRKCGHTNCPLLRSLVAQLRQGDGGLSAVVVQAHGSHITVPHHIGTSDHHRSPSYHLTKLTIPYLQIVPTSLSPTFKQRLSQLKRSPDLPYKSHPYKYGSTHLGSKIQGFLDDRSFPSPLLSSDYRCTAPPWPFLSEQSIHPSNISAAPSCLTRLGTHTGGS
ncbi:hypothetical protein EJ06DRAFT_135175 [Trichodelitschia bisporula]|uniref:Uncharacterized protein n=1 Tax=Trichodelitschia bisporula TaxID=703511 RepID=A0A6G1HPE1_9PEZI|nr:hypothetical protein EJ06DRAFT_135175 [Trichodelitschia bisporula]